MTSEAVCELIHNAMRILPRYSLSEPPFEPANGVYALFQPDETGHSGDRIVRIGSHTGEGNLPARLREHMAENKDRSILRKHIGRAILRQTGDPYLAIWDLDYTCKAVRETKGHLLDPVKQAQIEAAVSEYISCFSVSVLPMGSPQEARRLERLCIGTVSSCGSCGPSRDWLGAFADRRIARSGLWQVMHLEKDGVEIDALRSTEESLRCIWL